MTGVELLTFPAVTENVVEVEPLGTVTDDGTFAPAGDEVKVIVAPALGAADVRLTVQVDPPDGLIEAGLHEKPFKLGARMVTVPPVAEVDREVPVESAIITLESWTEDDVSVVDPDNVRVSVATTLFASA